MLVVVLLGRCSIRVREEVKDGFDVGRVRRSGVEVDLSADGEDSFEIVDDRSWSGGKKSRKFEEVAGGKGRKGGRRWNVDLSDRWRRG